MNPDLNRPCSLPACSRNTRGLLPLVLLGLSFLMTGCGTQNGEAEAEKPVVRPVKSLLLPYASEGVRSFPGTVRAVRRVDLAFNVPGRIIEFPAKEGERVARDALLARLDPQNYQMAADAARAEYENALADYRRYKKLVEQDFVSRADYDKMVAKKEQAEADLERASKRLEDTYLRAPFNGVVARRFVENFTDVKTRQPVLSLQETRQLEVVVDLPEDVIIGEKPDQKIKMVATFSAMPGLKLPVTVKEYATRADPKTLTYRVIFALPEITEANILPGMTARVTFIPQAEDDSRPTFSIPASALLEADGKQWLWVIEPSTHSVSRREVKAEKSGDGKVLVYSGVEPGELIAVAGVHYLKQGLVVKPIQEILY